MPYIIWPPPIGIISICVVVVSLPFTCYCQSAIAPLLAILQVSTYLIALDVPDNCLRKNGAEALASVLEGGMVPHLQRLNLSGNILGNDGVIKVAEALQCPSCSVRLSELRIGRNGAASKATDKFLGLIILNLGPQDNFEVDVASESLRRTAEQWDICLTEDPRQKGPPPKLEMLVRENTDCIRELKRKFEVFQHKVGPKLDELQNSVFDLSSRVTHIETLISQLSIGSIRKNLDRFQKELEDLRENVTREQLSSTQFMQRVVTQLDEFRSYSD